ncbi:DUF1450 domain-containing protein [Peribacillus glennii]|uniref:DUF1450 domain-containing protein n=1 Tax=Peribacillus glennii TaxID=2303991 RepID=A0A372LDQ3_9BACI|nr:DUF1450 domain-containing protein [Peribacillus glennii]RFU63838.1 DUF1450 domain-containing protein [Peribacillus glennii]
MKEEDIVKSFITKLFSKEQKVVVEFCQKNLDRFLTEDNFPLFQDFLAQPSIEYKEFECLSHCRLCKKSPYAQVDGEMIMGESPEDLLQKLKRLNNG